METIEKLANLHEKNVEMLPTTARKNDNVRRIMLERIITIVKKKSIGGNS